MYPGSTSDCLAFEEMALFQKLEEGILAPGLCIFGDNAYINTPYMATPYANVSGGTKDSYNFYHSQLRIRIECAFGMLTHRWGILRSAIPMGVSIKKTVALVLALAKLHNYCINCNDSDAPSATASDAWRSELNGAEPLVATTEHYDSNRGVTPHQLLHGGHHSDDLGINGRRIRQQRYDRRATNAGELLPRDTMHLMVDSLGITRPSLVSARRRISRSASRTRSR